MKNINEIEFILSEEGDNGERTVMVPDENAPTLVAVVPKSGERFATLIEASPLLLDACIKAYEELKRLSPNSDVVSYLDMAITEATIDEDEDYLK